MEITDYNKLAQEVHENALKHGFWQEHTSDEHFLCLVVAELMEAVEAHRHGKKMRETTIGAFEFAVSLQPHEYAYWFNDFIKDTVEDELADAFIRLLDLAGAHEYDINSRIERPIRWEVRTNEEQFTENVWDIVCMLSMRIAICQRTRVIYAMRMLQKLAQAMGCDLAWHIEHKMQYNATRPYKHGKAY